MAGLFGNILSALSIGAGNSVRRNAGDTAFEEFTPALPLTRNTGAIIYAALTNGTLALAFGTNSTVKVTPTATGSFTTTVPAAGCEAALIILTSGTTSFTMTFGAGFKPVSTLATGTVSGKLFTVYFLSDGVSLIETGRTTAH
jgi:hypothetical protein